MKRFIFVFQRILLAWIIPIPVHQRTFQKPAHAMMLMMIVFSFSSCFKQYYCTNTVNLASRESFERLDSAKRYYILHSPQGPFTIKNLRINENGIGGDLASLPAVYDSYLNPKMDKPNGLKHSQKHFVLAQVHIYTNDSSQTGNLVTLRFSQISRLDVYGIDKKATKESTITSIVGIALATGAIIFIGAISTLSFHFTY